MSSGVIKRRIDRYSMVQSSFSSDSQEIQYDYLDIDLRTQSPESNQTSSTYSLPTNVTLQIISAVCSDESDQKDLLKSTGKPCYPMDRRAAMTQNPHWQMDSTTKEISSVSVIVKLFMLGVIKFSSLDPFGMGIEMEGGKPGWNDALNGLPGMFGSGMSETYETVRLFEFLQNSLHRIIPLTLNCSLELPIEMSEFYLSLLKLTRHWQTRSSSSSSSSSSSTSCLDSHSTHRQCQFLNFQFWNDSNTLREEYLLKVSYSGTFHGNKLSHSCQEIVDQLSEILFKLKNGIQRSLLTQEKDSQNEVKVAIVVPPTYFYYTVKSIEYISSSNTATATATATSSSLLYLPTEFEQHTLPLFLEGSVRMLKICHSVEEKSVIYHMV
jgi:hypothetical protein